MTVITPDACAARTAMRMHAGRSPLAAARHTAGATASDLPTSVPGFRCLQQQDCDAGTLLTAELALERGLACNTAGGTHHAFPGHGSGFCILNDLAYTAQVRGRLGGLQNCGSMHSVLRFFTSVLSGLCSVSAERSLPATESTQHMATSAVLWDMFTVVP